MCDEQNLVEGTAESTMGHGTRINGFLRYTAADESLFPGRAGPGAASAERGGRLNVYRGYQKLLSPGCRVAGCCRVGLPGCRGVAGSVPGCRVLPGAGVLPGCCRVLPGAAGANGSVLFDTAKTSLGRFDLKMVEHTTAASTR